MWQERRQRHTWECQAQGATVRTFTKEAILETWEWETSQQEKRIHRTCFEREATKFSFTNFTFFTREKKEAIKIVGRCASYLSNFQRIAFNMIGI